jgi:two-component system, NarL family, invasion response regulator UvrY
MMDQHRVARILVADDHPVVVQGIRQMITLAPDLDIAAEASDARSALEGARVTVHDVVVLDLSLPGGDGLEILKQLKRERPKIPVLIFTMYAEDQFAVRALRAGAAGYVTKSSPPADLVSAIRKAVSGGRYVSPAVAEALAAHVAENADSLRHHQLSDREYQVFRMIASGKPTRQIAVDLSLSVKTVATYRARIFEKMQMTTPAELAAYAVRHRLTE